MAEIDLPSSGDESDEDFVPEGEPSSDEGSSSAHSGDISDEDKGHKSRKRRKLSKKKKSTKAEDKNVKEEEEEKVEKVTDVDALWADFKEDVKKMEERILSHQVYVAEKPSLDSSNEKPKKPEEPEKPQKPEALSKDEPQEVEGAGAARTQNAGSGNKGRILPPGMNRGNKLGLNKILEHISKKEKMSTLAKSKMDWIKFTKSEGIEEEIKKHNKGKDGYLEKQDFLQRTDLRQFEIEKQLRASKRNQ